MFGSRIAKKNSSQISSSISHIYAKIWICKVVYSPTGRLKEAVLQTPLQYGLEITKS